MNAVTRCWDWPWTWCQRRFLLLPETRSPVLGL